MSLSKKREKEIDNVLLEGGDILEYIQRKKVPNGLNIWGNVFLGYLSSAILIQHSNTLNRWTKVIVGTSVALIVFAIAQIILLIFKV